MQFEQLQQLNQQIRDCPNYEKENPGCNRCKVFRPVVNVLRPTQKYLIISSDPSSDTDKSKTDDVPHSDFALRFLALIFHGNDGEEHTSVVMQNYVSYKRIFDKYFYWTHFSKCHAKGNPNNFCAKNYLLKEINLFEPELIISLGAKPVDFLLGKDNLLNRVNRTLDYNGVPLYASLHPSRNWNLQRRPEFSFNETWGLIRSAFRFNPQDI